MSEDSKKEMPKKKLPKEEFSKEELPKKAKNKPASAKKSKKKPNIFLIILFVILLGVFLFSGYQLFSILREYQKGAEAQSEVRDIFYQEASAILDTEGKKEQRVIHVEEESLPEEELAKLIDSKDDAMALLSPLQAINPDAIGWITIPDSKIDYVVMKGATNDTYLYTTFYGEYNSSGSIFMDYNNEVGAALENYILHGHHMKDGSMFHDLDLYKSREWLDKHPNFTLVLPDGIYDCRVYAVILCTVYDDLWQTSFPTIEDKEAYIAYIRSLSMHDVPVEVTGNDQIVTLSTCDYTKGDKIGRMMIQAKITKRWYKVEDGFAP